VSRRFQKRRNDLKDRAFRIVISDDNFAVLKQTASAQRRVIGSILKQTAPAQRRRIKDSLLVSKATRDAENRFSVVKRLKEKGSTIETLVYEDSRKPKGTKRSFWGRLINLGS
jgi:hypothetical protein